MFFSEYAYGNDMLWHDGSVFSLDLICVAMQVLMKKVTQRLFSMLLRQKKEEHSA